MHFPAAERLLFPCRFAQIVPGRMSADGRQVLPVVVLQPLSSALPAVGVVDRHHVVDPSLRGREGSARLVFLLSRFRVQTPPFRQGLGPEPGARDLGFSSMPEAFGRVLDVLTWEVEHEHLPYEALYVELLLDVGSAVVGLRTSATAASLAQTLGKARIEPGDWLHVERSRVDILAFHT
ncbi:MAG TPA: hypothetical protein VFS21_18250 [Roseiflexaceae bacterium]|nr:hypothetical protein [Roseiflexaceae bacterium]